MTTPKRRRQKRDVLRVLMALSEASGREESEEGRRPMECSVAIKVRVRASRGAWSGGSRLSRWASCLVPGGFSEGGHFELFPEGGRGKGQREERWEGMKGKGTVRIHIIGCTLCNRPGWRWRSGDRRWRHGAHGRICR